MKCVAFKHNWLPNKEPLLFLTWRIFMVSRRSSFSVVTGSAFRLPKVRMLKTKQTWRDFILMVYCVLRSVIVAIKNDSIYILMNLDETVWDATEGVDTMEQCVGGKPYASQIIQCRNWLNYYIKTKIHFKCWRLNLFPCMFFHWGKEGFWFWRETVCQKYSFSMFRDDVI